VAVGVGPDHVTGLRPAIAQTCMAPAELRQSASPQEHHKHTVVRLAKIQSHLATAPRTDKLKGKVAIITGVGSLKGIGYTAPNVSIFYDPDLLRRRASALSLAHEGQ
jgi:hypothetical protein